MLSVYFTLFITFFKIGLFAFGGGYAVISLIQHDIVDMHPEWDISLQEFANIVAISQSTPGPIGINAATYVGFSVTQTWIGAAIATTAMVMPSFIIMTAICIFLKKLSGNQWVQQALAGLRPATIGLIASAALMLCNKEIFIDYKSYAIFAVALPLSLYKKIHPMWIIIAAGIAGLILY